MSGIKRRMSRQKIKQKETLEIGAYIEGGDISIIMTQGNWIGRTGVENTGLPDNELPWLAGKIVDRIVESGLCTPEDFLCIADQVIEEEKLTIIMLTTKGKSPP